MKENEVKKIEKYSATSWLKPTLKTHFHIIITILISAEIDRQLQFKYQLWSEHDKVV